MQKVILLCALVLCVQANTHKTEKHTSNIGGQIVADTGSVYDDGRSYHNSKLRRVRIYAKGDISHYLSYEIEHSFAGKKKWKDVYVKYTKTSAWSIYAGNIKEPFGLESLTSSKYNTFMERALADLYSSRKMGLLFKGYLKSDKDVVTYALGGFGKSLDEAIEHKKGDASLVARVTFAKVATKKEIFHLGLSASYAAQDKSSVKLASDAGSDLYQNSFIKTKVKKVDHTTRIGIESAVVSGALSFQGEYIKYNIVKELVTYNFSGWYALVSWFLTGESRSYKTKTALFSRIKPLKPVDRGGYGAVELAFRVTELDLSDRDENGGKERDLTFGVNWYLKSNLRLMGEYTNAVEWPEEVHNVHILQFRMQYDFRL